MNSGIEKGLKILLFTNAKSFKDKDLEHLISETHNKYLRLILLKIKIKIENLVLIMNISNLLKMNEKTLDITLDHKESY